jgi:hypothetical protein
MSHLIELAGAQLAVAVLLIGRNEQLPDIASAAEYARNHIQELDAALQRSNDKLYYDWIFRELRELNRIFLNIDFDKIKAFDRADQSTKALFKQPIAEALNIVDKQGAGRFRTA